MYMLIRWRGVRQVRGGSPTRLTIMTATQIATPSVQPLCARSEGRAAPITVDICKQRDALGDSLSLNH